MIEAFLLGSAQDAGLPQASCYYRNGVDARSGLIPPQSAVNLLFPLTPLIGREQEIAAAKDRLRRAEVRLLTLTGPGGVGKTRLGLQVAHDLIPHFRDGVVFVSLASIRDSTLVVTAIGQALGLREAGSRPLFTQLQAHLRDRQALLLLDNFEQVVEAAPQVAELLIACPSVKALVTSRMALHLSGEHEHPVLPLALPDLNHLPAMETLAQIDAVQLFTQRAAALKPNFHLDAANARLVAEICHRLDGLPLAVELAAALVKALPLQAILSRLDHRLHVLIGGPRDLPPRQQTLLNTIAWSYNLLNAEEQRLFRALAVFVGGFTLEAVSAIIHTKAPPRTEDWVLHTVAALVDKNLLKQVAPDDSEPRYAMLETIREYGLECLEASGEVAALRKAHTAYYLVLAETGEGKLKTAAQEAWLTRLEMEHANLRAALRWAIDQHEVETVLRLCGALGRFWFIHGHLSEGRRWAAEALSILDFRFGILDLGSIQQSKTCGGTIQNRSTEAHERLKSKLGAWAKTLNGAGALAYYQSDYGQAAVLCEKSLTLYRHLGDQDGIATALYGLAAITRSGGNYPAARAMYQESLTIYRTLGDRWGVAYTSMYLGVALFFQGDPAAARPLVEESLVTFRILGCGWDIANALFNLGITHWCLGDYGLARLVSEESLVIMHTLGDRRGVARAFFSLGTSTFAQDDYGAAAPLFKESLTIFRELGDRWFMTQCLIYTAWLNVGHQPERAAQLCGAVEALRQAIHSPTPTFNHAEYEHNLALLRARLDEATFQAAWVSGRTWTWEQAIEFALAALGTAPLSTQTQPDSQPSPAPTTSSRGYPAGLTTREVEVLRLVATGLTDAQVAEQLIISPRTVNTHLTSVYNKLGVSSRMAATHYAIEHHLV